MTLSYMYGGCYRMTYKKGILISLLCVLVFSLGGCDFWYGVKSGFSTKIEKVEDTEKK